MRGRVSPDFRRHVRPRGSTKADRTIGVSLAPAASRDPVRRSARSMPCELGNFKIVKSQRPGRSPGEWANHSAAGERKTLWSNIRCKRTGSLSARLEMPGHASIGYSSPPRMRGFSRLLEKSAVIPGRPLGPGPEPENTGQALDFRSPGEWVPGVRAMPAPRNDGQPGILLGRVPLPCVPGFPLSRERRPSY